MLRKIHALALSMLCAFCLNAQQRGASRIDLSAYPVVSFIWNEYNSDEIDISAVQLKLDGKKIPFTWKPLESQVDKDKNMSILVLWEDMASHDNQSDFTSKVLKGFLEQTQPSNNRFNIVSFNRDKGDGNLLQPLTGGFTSNLPQLLLSIESFNPDKSKFSKDKHPLSTNLYQAISDGLKLLEPEPADNFKAIMVFTAGFNMMSSGSPKEFCSTKALKQNVPIYVVKYPYKDDKSRKDVEGIEEITNGELIAPDRTTDIESTVDNLVDAYYRMVERNYGRDYLVKFAVEEKDYNTGHDVALCIKGTENVLTVTSPAATFSDWIADNLIICIIAGAALLIIIALIIFFIVRSNRKRKRERSENLRNLESIKQESASIQQDLQNRIDNQKQEYEDRLMAEQQEKIAKDMEAEEKRLLNIIKVKNLNPCLIFESDGVNHHDPLTVPMTTIGRETDNDIVINDGTVSRHHAEIMFDGQKFILRNLSKTNSTIVNGAFIDMHELRSGDLIGIGKVVMKFYL